MDALGTKIVCQIGLIVRDIERSAQKYAEFFHFDMPEIIATDPDAYPPRFRGGSSRARAKLAFFEMDNVQIELIQPLAGPSTWQEYLDRHGEGIHHLAFFVKGMDGVLTRLKGAGFELVQAGDYQGGRYAYVDTVPALHTMIELLENEE